MTKQLFVRTDPVELDRYEVKQLPRRLKFSIEKVRLMDLFKRALQSLPPRELQMLYTDLVLEVSQEEASTIFCVRQSNMSYRLQRAQRRIVLYHELNSIISETDLRKTLLNLGLSEHHILIVLGVVKTTSQSATAQAFDITQGSVRYIFSTACKALETHHPDSPAHKLFQAVEKNYNQLRAIQAQERWSWKVQGSNYALDEPGEAAGQQSWDTLCLCR